MIRRAWRTVVGVFASAGLAVGLLLFVGVWSLLATIVAQGEAAGRDVTAWATTHPFIEPLVRALGLHRAFTAPVFLGAVFLLVISIAVCAWRRTKVSLARSRTLRTAARVDGRSLAESHDLEIACDSRLSESDALAVTSDALGRLGIRVKRRADLLSVVSAPWSVWGSAIFHWALVGLIAAVLLGQMLRSEGSMAVAVGETKRDAPVSYLSVSAGPWHAWGRVHRSVRVDSVEPDYKTGGVDRGAVPTVSVLDGAGNVVVRQRVYPNNMLHSGSLAINVPAVGLSATLVLQDASGAETGRFIQPVDFSQTATDGTLPATVLTRRDAAGNPAMGLYVTVPLDRAVNGSFGEWIPRQPTARVVVTTAQGKHLLDRVARPGETVALPGGGTVRLVGIGWYSRLSLVDDPTIPLIYATMIFAMLGLTMTLVFRQQLVVATFVERPDGPVLAMRLRLWRNTSTSRAEIEGALTEALSGAAAAWSDSGATTAPSPDEENEL